MTDDGMCEECRVQRAAAGRRVLAGERRLLFWLMRVTVTHAALWRLNHFAEFAFWACRAPAGEEAALSDGQTRQSRLMAVA